ncbi:LAMI_0B08548g1_1 [Lachancea mirantina]|uniref:LAMI_0B08548g1_1 n=1 Tax=Lachancea mirantina TaxID=1230905 RepID=A0A1G4IYC5_9SACH|nr:LAMI_0B08548g1_1 [Lachancea mirantina]
MKDSEQEQMEMAAQGRLPSNQGLSSRQKGYMIVAAGFIANFFVFGFAFTFGVFQDFYLSQSGPLSGRSTSSVSVIGTVATALTYMLTLLNTGLSAYFSVRQIMLSGAILMSLGFIAASFAHELWQFSLSQGLLFGIGGSMVYLPPVVHAPPYFTSHRGIAMGLLFSGTGAGGLALAPLTRYLITKFGWQWALRICGIIGFAALAPASLLVHPYDRTAAAKVKNPPRLNLKVMTSDKFILHMMGASLQSAGYLIPTYFMSSYAQTLGFTYNQGAVFIGINNTVNALSKVVVGFFSDRFGRLNMLVICGLLSCITIFALWLVTTRGAFIAFVICYGVASGPIVSLLPTCMAELFGVQNYQATSWFLYFCRGIGTFLGSPIAGLLISNKNARAADYRNAIVYNGVLFAVSFFCLCWVRFREAYNSGWKIKQ